MTTNCNYNSLYLLQFRDSYFVVCLLPSFFSSSMDIWQKMIFPVRRVWLALSARIKSTKHGRGLLKLEDDVQTCGYEDVQVMWEMLRRSETLVVDKYHNRNKRKQHMQALVIKS